MINFWFLGDTHFHHSNLVRGTSLWENKDRCRNFDSVEEHDAVLIDNINKVVKQNDILYHLGDVAMGGYQNVYNFRKQIIVKTIHLLLGNHDIGIRHNKIIETEDGYINSQNLFTTVDKLLTKKINGQDMTLCHFPLRSWEKGSQGSWNIHGHCHGTLIPFMSEFKNKEGNRDCFKQLDVGIDTHKEFMPYHFDEIAEIMKGRTNLNIDHHE